MNTTRNSHRETWRKSSGDVNATLLRLDEVMWDNYGCRDNRDNVCRSFLLGFVRVAEYFVCIRSIPSPRKKRGDNRDQYDNILWRNHHVVTRDLHDAICSAICVAKRLWREASCKPTSSLIESDDQTSIKLYNLTCQILNTCIIFVNR